MAALSSIRLRSLDGVQTLEFDQPSLSGRGLFRCNATLTVDDGFHGVALEMIEPFRRFWLEFFGDLAACQSGWSGVKHWSSEFGEVDLVARHDEAEVTLDVTFQAPEPTADEPSATIRLRPGDLPRLRDELAAFLRLG